jgi:DNA repair protein RecN (Recombination protein N)
MLCSLQIQNYAVIDRLSLEFGPGFNLLSGETGSGKSILVDALGLGLGGRASPEVIRTGEERASVAAVFRADLGAAGPAWKSWLDELGLEGAGDPEIILRREVHTSGKSRMLVNDQPVTVNAVRDLARILVEVHGQSEHVALLEAKVQLELLDEFAENEAILEKVRERYERRSELEAEIAEIGRGEQTRIQEIDRLRFETQELKAAALVAGEDTRLEDEKRVLANLEKIRAAAAGAYSALYDDDLSASSRLAAVARLLEDLANYAVAFEAHRGPLDAARATVDDLARFLRGYLGKLDANPHRLEGIEDRLALLDRLKRKYGMSIPEILRYQEQIRTRLDVLDSPAKREDELRGELRKVRAEYSQAARELSARRRESARSLEKLTRAELTEMGMEKTRFEIRFTPLAEESGGARGIDAVEFQISPNPGEDLRPLEKIASGGELSRLMLALKTVVGSRRVAGETRPRGAAPTFVFDEVDAGIGGRVAEFVGRRLRRLARAAQVVAVSHLAQIACFADQQFRVEKQELNGRTVTFARPLESEKERTEELARMLSGAQVTDLALRHAAAMLKQARRGDSA